MFWLLPSQWFCQNAARYIKPKAKSRFGSAMLEIYHTHIYVSCKIRQKVSVKADLMIRSLQCEHHFLRWVCLESNFLIDDI